LIMALELIKIEQPLKGDKIDDVESTVSEEIEASNIEIKKGSKIAIAIGSRGISNLPEIVGAVVSSIRDMGAEPFLVPAMGSHGGATADGQREVLASLGVTEKSVVAPIMSSMAVSEIPSGRMKTKIYMDKYAWESDGVILVNRIKPHTDFHGLYESGLVKMSVIGLGKHTQALEIHRYGVEGLRDLTPECARKVFDTGKIILGLAVVENAFDETSIIRALRPEEILKKEPELLKYARKNMPRLPVNNIDVLIVDSLGKDISGTGLDPNIIGRMKIRGEVEPIMPKIKNIIVTDITEASHGNAVGVGFADVITRKLFENINFSSTYENVVTSTFLERAKIPIVADNVKKAFEIAYRASGPIKDGKERVVRIKNTLDLAQVYVSHAIYDDIKDKVTPSGSFTDILDEKGNLKSF